MFEILGPACDKRASQQRRRMEKLRNAKRRLLAIRIISPQHRKIEHPVRRQLYTPGTGNKAWEIVACPQNPLRKRGIYQISPKNLINAGLEDVSIVTIPGVSVKSLIKKPTQRSCDLEDCLLCPLEVPCGIKHLVYSITCNLCGPDQESEYIGASRRPPAKRMMEHEASARRFNKRTSVGQHMIKCHG